jgi:hypothetical protein
MGLIWLRIVTGGGRAHVNTVINLGLVWDGMDWIDLAQDRDQ